MKHRPQNLKKRIVYVHSFLFEKNLLIECNVSCVVSGCISCNIHMSFVHWCLCFYEKSSKRIYTISKPFHRFRFFFHGGVVMYMRHFSVACFSILHINWLGNWWANHKAKNQKVKTVGNESEKKLRKQPYRHSDKYTDKKKTVILLYYLFG